jgi:hypothetical protein
MAGKYHHANNTVAAYSAIAVTESDSTVIPVTRSLYIGVTGDLVVRMANGETATFVAVPVGILPIQVDQVHAATTAESILALY